MGKDEGNQGANEAHSNRSLPLSKDASIIAYGEKGGWGE